MEIEVKNGKVIIDDTTIISERDKDDDEAIELEIKQGEIKIKESAIISTKSEKIIVGHEDHNGDIGLDEKTIVVEAIDFKTKNGNITDESLKKTMEELGPLEDLPGMPKKKADSNKNSYEKGYYKNEE